MAVEMINLENLKIALRIDYDDEDIYLKMCLDAAIEHLKSAVDDYETKIKEESFIKKTNIILVFTVQKLFDERTFNDDTKTSTKINHIVSSLLTQMR